jgi:hypothetical protein
MRPNLCCLGILSTLLLLCWSPTAHAQTTSRKKPGPYDRVANGADYVALGQMKEVVGQLLAIEGEQQLTIKVEYPALAPKGRSTTITVSSSTGKPRGSNNAAVAAQKLFMDQLRLQAQFLKGMEQVLKIRNPIQQQQHRDKLLANLQTQQMKLAQKQAKLASGSSGGVSAGTSSRTTMKVVTASVEFQLPLVDKLRVAKAFLPVRLDAEGKVISYTAEELRKQGDPKMPGFRAGIDELQPVQLVRVYLAPSKAVEKGKTKDKSKKEMVDEDVDLPPEKDYRPQARMVLILTAPEPTAKAAKKKQKSAQ